MTNQELRARTAILPEFASMAMNAGEQLQDAQLSKGFVPNELQPLVDEAITGAAPTFSDRPLTDLELSTLDTWFVAHPEKIAGMQIAGSGYIAPIRTRGNMEDLERVFAFLDEEPVQSSEFNVQSEPVLNSQTANIETERLRLESVNEILDEELKKFSVKYPSELGGVSDYGRSTPEYKEAKKAFDKSFEELRAFNQAHKPHKPKQNDRAQMAKIKAKAKAKASAAALRLKRKNETV